jgi:hypothetical protein
MATNFRQFTRLEPRWYERNLEAGFQSPIHDPAWFLARQWQMGEHQGENATSPVWVQYRLRSLPIRSADPRFDPREIPAEAIVESEVDDWWTMGRRVRIGKRLVGHPAVQGRVELRFDHPAPPYEHFHGQVDGRAAWRRRVELNLADADFGAEIPADSSPAWDTAQLLYQQNANNAFSTDEHRLTVTRHHGGRLDWHSVAGFPVGLVDAEGELRDAIPAALQYPGAPNSRWWQIEDAEVDYGGYAPDSAHIPTAILTELIFSHSDDWFLFPALARAGHVVEIESLEVTDAFGRKYRSQELNPDGNALWPGLNPPEGWTLFQVDGASPGEEGLPRASLLLWHVAELPLESIPIERVQFGLDEESNLLWAVERNVDGREVDARTLGQLDEETHPKFNLGRPAGDASQPKEYAYVPGQGIAPYWHPYKINEEGGLRRLVHQRLVDLSRQVPAPMPAPVAEVLQSGVPDQLHQVDPLAIPSNGIELERRWQLARDMHGRPVLWIQRRGVPLLSPPGRRLRFDVLEEARE